MDYSKRIAAMQEMLPQTNPVHVFKAPGRVNLIGEHTDYNNCPVLPFAVDREIIGVCQYRQDNRISVRDKQDKFGSIEFTIAQKIAPYQRGNWGNYIKAGVQGILDFWPDLPANMGGFDMVIHSTIPPAAGMSSSSALVVLASLVFLGANGIEVVSQKEKLFLAECCAKSERYTGTQGGGMDQAAILLGESQKALLINFNPLRCKKAPLPESHTLVVAHSLVEAPKTQTVMDAYNRRSTECRLATALISKELEATYQVSTVEFMGDLLPEKTGLSEAELRDVIQHAVVDKPYSVADIAQELEISEQQVISKYCLRNDGSIFPVPEEGFLLYERLTHVLNEWKRVLEAYESLHADDMIKLGQLMNASHASCRDLHQVSCNELDILTEISRKSGAIGSRLTGAGFGGCTINLVPNELLKDYIQRLGESYYRDIMQRTHWDDMIFIVTPESGARRLV
ncbi:MAG: galactokinase [Sphaerochaetaceae bacterium]|jgi:N-acetylgalactosamine kinase|nr:galactokinase [Sphaerochaetaceae bacterium]